MPKYNAKEQDPARYARAMEEQSRLREQCCGQYTLARICPFCDHKVEILYRGSHGPSSLKCPVCGEEVVFPPVSFRRNRAGA
jgi:rRNA maturation protein Nop10